MSTFVTESTPPYDPAALAESLASAAEKSAKMIGDFASRNAGKGRTLPSDELGLGKAFMEVAAQMLANPARLAESQMNLWWEYMSLWQGSMLRLMGAQATPVAVPAKGDKRFKHEDWHEHFLFDYIKQSYLITARWMHDQVASVEGLDEQTKERTWPALDVAAGAVLLPGCSRAEDAFGLPPMLRASPSGSMPLRSKQSRCGSICGWRT